MICSIAAIAFFLGYMPPPGSVIEVPRSKVAPLTERQRKAGEKCARQYDIKWKIAEDK